MAEIPTQTLQEASGDAVGQVVRSKDPIADVSKLLSPAPAPVESSPETGSQQAPPDESWELKSVAERLGTDPEKLYTGLKVALDDGTELSVSALKDAYRPAAELEKARGELLEEMTASKREVTQNRQELGALVAYLAQNGQLTESAVREVQKMVDAERTAEADKLLKRIPEWKDPIARAADWSDIRKVAKEQGYTDAEIKLAEAGLADHRTIATWRALAKGPKPAAPAKPAAKVAAKPAAGSRTPAQQFGSLKAAVKTGRTSPFSAVAQLIGEK
jgi:hypothetical protein